MQKAEAAGLRVLKTADACKEADVIMVLLPDTEQARVYKEDIEPNLKDRERAFAHGFNIHFGHIVPPKGVDVFMIAPKGPGHLVRSEFQKGGGVPCLLAVSAGSSGNAKQIGARLRHGASAATRAGVLDTTFKEETETDLFGEQVVLCGGLTELDRGGLRDPRRTRATSPRWRTSRACTR